MKNGWLPIRMARHLGAAKAESGKARRFMFWVKGHGHDFGHVYLGKPQRRNGLPRLIAVPENCRGRRVVALKVLPRGPFTREPGLGRVTGRASWL